MILGTTQENEKKNLIVTLYKGTKGARNIFCKLKSILSISLDNRFPNSVHNLLIVKWHGIDWLPSPLCSALDRKASTACFVLALARVSRPSVAPNIIRLLSI